MQEAESRFSELLEASLEQGPQIVTRRGVETAVLLPIELWRRLESLNRTNLKELLLAPEARTENLIPSRQQNRRRATQAVE
ncbi:MAG: type II toxin-antitoxin system prevent-host-death family antitoxin [Caldilineaceae bacterium SB0664_bin_27]|uniref:Antitoxin n=1 Tax=Caldilineaceae bacterium SB0664_bin_27 TaxID=2605260 RepID=A0A6B0YSU6_9CHLR|nr:type II toxin-antitoxin system prevent-host-death family antitoxin [Caldilineaceae bacterium SB0664_bin_27]